MNKFELSLPRRISPEEYEAERHHRLPPSELQPEGLYVCCAQIRQGRGSRAVDSYIAYPARVFRVTGQLVRFAMLDETYAETTQYEEPFPGGLWQFTNPASITIVADGYMADMSVFDGMNELMRGTTLDLQLNL